jgi:hypothetical protein
MHIVSPHSSPLILSRKPEKTFPLEGYQIYLTLTVPPSPLASGCLQTVMSPFISISADDRHMSVSSQFSVF